MLQITIPSVELFDELKQEFVYTKEQPLCLEHSLVSISKWESKWCKPWWRTFAKKSATIEETIDYVRCMTLTKNVDSEVYEYLTNDNIEKISKYISAPMTATWFSNEDKGKQNDEEITSELIYYWMIALQIPVEFQKWHLNRLLTLIRICNVKNKPPKKMSKKEIMNRNAALNAARTKRLNTRG